MNSRDLNARPVVLLARLYLGGIFLLAGGGKIFGDGVSNFAAYISQQFQGTILPELFLTAISYTLPYVEFLLGILLVAGLLRKFSFTVAGLVFLALSQGQFILGEYATAAHNGVYFLVAIIALLLVRKPTLAVDTLFHTEV